jgi:basic amino acid/polyamine antiporter, APA family
MSEQQNVEELDDYVGSPSALKMRTFGLTTGTGLVVSSVVGTSIFSLPALLARSGTISLAVLGGVGVVSFLLATLFGQLAKRIEISDGGPYAYVRYEFGDALGFLTGWCYWIRTWAGNAAIVMLWVGYVDALLGWHHLSAMSNWCVAVVGLWIPVAVNLLGVRFFAWFQGLTILIRYLPILFICIVGWGYVHSANFGPFRSTHISLYSAVCVLAGISLFTFVGVEAAGVAARRLRNPSRQVFRAGSIGSFLSVILFVGASAVVMGIVPHKQLVQSTTPFVTAFSTLYPHHAWAARAVAGIAAIAGLGALVTWSFLGTESAKALSNDGLFPKMFAQVDNKDTPWVGLIVGAVVPSLLLLWDVRTETGLNVVTSLIAFSGVLIAIPYFLSAMAQITHLFSRRSRLTAWRMSRDVLIALLGGAFALWMVFQLGYHVLYQSALVVVGGVIAFAIVNAVRDHHEAEA